MKAVKRYILKNWEWIVIGVVLTAASVKMAYVERDYVAYGGEWLILLLVLAVAGVMKD